ncbi:MAG: M1 family metallopeptidase, partial [Planctomycetota bacterium]
MRFALFFAIAAACSFISVGTAMAQPADNTKLDNRPDAFRQLDEWLPTPTETRLASGAPGPQYWQQNADYKIQITLDDDKQRLEGKETVTYHNRSPHTLRYLWFQLDQNRFDPNSGANQSSTASSVSSRLTFRAMESMLVKKTFDGGFKISNVSDTKGNTLQHTIVDTMMRIELPTPLKPNQSFVVNIDFAYNIVNGKLIRARGGYEFFEEDGNYIYEIAQWFPRVVSYTDYTGWQHKQFLGSGEFTLELGDYEVAITAPADHVVAATGTLTNHTEVLTAQQQQRLQDAAKANEPMFIVTPEEAKKAERRGKAADETDAKDKDAKDAESNGDDAAVTGTKTWRYTAKNVRDFAWASSRKFIWDAQGHTVDGGDGESKTVMAMSYYPNEAEPLWSKYSTHSIIHTLNIYSRYTFTYPYETAISVNGPVYGMEYPMICFNGPRPEKDGTYSRSTKYGLISVIIHEVGHNYFPMIVNSDERQWTWMDEGLNTFLQYLTEQEWEEDYPSRRGEPANITSYMASRSQRPIMTNSESVLQFGNNAYAKPATALNILRETIMGRELFDYAFKEYARRWKFKRPTPSDFFRTMEDASGVDLDWFWRGWFYSTDHVDIAFDGISLAQLDLGDPDATAARRRREKEEQTPSVSKERNADLPKRVDLFPGLKDYYNTEYDPLAVSEAARKAFRKYVDDLDPEQQKMVRENT